MPTKPKYRFGKNAVVRIAAIPVGSVAADGSVTKPQPGDFKVFCLHNNVSIGVANATFDLENFCTGGKTIKVRDGTKDGRMTIGDAQWVENDEALEILKDAVFSNTETGGWVYVEVLPLGIGGGKPAFDLIIDVLEWDLEMPSKGAITVKHQNFSVLEGPTEGVQPAA